MVHHSWLRRAIRAPKMVRRIVPKLIPLWRTDVEVMTEEGKVKIPIALKRAFFWESHCPFCYFASAWHCCRMP
jgi:hypothetical protein